MKMFLTTLRSSHQLATRMVEDLHRCQILLTSRSRTWYRIL